MCLFQGAVLGGSHSLGPLTGCVFLLNVEKNRPTGEGGWLHCLRQLLRQASLSTNNIFTFLLSWCLLLEAWPLFSPDASLLCSAWGSKRLSLTMNQSHFPTQMSHPLVGALALACMLASICLLFEPRLEIRGWSGRRPCPGWKWFWFILASVLAELRGAWPDAQGLV